MKSNYEVLPVILFSILSLLSDKTAAQQDRYFSIWETKGRDFKIKICYVAKCMADYKDAKGFIIVFTCNHCPFAKKCRNKFIAFSRQINLRRYILLAINPGLV
jgi:hypothetical protein